MLKKLKSFFKNIFSNKNKKEIHFTTIAFPMIRSIIPSMLFEKNSEPENVYTREVIIEKTGFKTKKERKMNERLISVIPISSPTGLSFYLDYRYENTNLLTRKILIEKYKKNNVAKIIQRKMLEQILGL